MQRPTEYDNLIKTRAFEAVSRIDGALQGFLKHASEDLEVAKSIDERRSKQRFTLAYEGFYGVVQAVMEFHEVRTKEAGRNLAILRVAHDLGLGPGEIKLVADAHARRNEHNIPLPVSSNLTRGGAGNDRYPREGASPGPRFDRYAVAAPRWECLSR